jgi:hypothetical protein
MTKFGLIGAAALSAGARPISRRPGWQHSHALVAEQTRRKDMEVREPMHRARRCLAALFSGVGCLGGLASR